MEISGFTIIRNASRLDFPLEASIRSVLPVVSEFVVNVGASEDDTLARVRAIGDPRIRIMETIWDPGRGVAMLADETARALAACRAPWAIYIQADEVFADGSAELVRAAIERADCDPRIEGVIVDYRHFYGGFDMLASNRKWYRREVRAVRVAAAAAIHPYRDAQGFRVGPRDRKIRAIRSGAVMHHYGWARPEWALRAKRTEDAGLDAARQRLDANRPLLPWIPGIRRFTATHPAAMRPWIAERTIAGTLIEPWRFRGEHLRYLASAAVEGLTGWRPFEFRNYVTYSSPRSSNR
ncbi:MAG TPA: hypothetical protein VGL65_06235 [Gemmatimonadales bacterium]